jgi:DNA-binding SARP family transcriptional activator
VRELARSTADTRRRIHEYNIAQMALLHAVAVGDIEEAERMIPRAHASALASGMQYVQMQATLLQATSRALAGDVDGTKEACQSLARMTAATCFTWYQTEARFVHALAAYRAGARDEATDILRDAFREARISRYHFPERSYAEFAALCGIALDAGIEAEYVEDLVRRFRLPAPDPAAQHWPWPIEIVTLGDFRILRDGVPIEFGTRAPRKVLALLKALVALGGINVPQASLVDALWSDEEGDAAINALGVTVSRLRKLLDCPEAILVVDEQISINTDRCWVDAFQFDALTRSFRVDGGDAGARRLIERALLMYRGPFLPGDTGHPWSMQMRMRLRDRFVHFIERAGGRLEACGDFEGAMGCYRRGLEADDLAEQFYQGLMRCYLALERRAEGMQVYRRLRQTLSVLLGIAPSEQSDAIAASLRGRPRSAGGPAGGQDRWEAGSAVPE